MSKKTLFTLAIVVALSLTGCAGKENKESTDSLPPVDSTVNAASEEASAPVEDMASEGFAEEAAAPVVDTKDEVSDGKTIIEISWDNADVEYTGDPYEYDFGTDQMVGLHTYYEGDPITCVESTDEGTIHKEKYEITDSEKYVMVLVEPDAPVNNCPMETITLKITHPDGTVEEPEYEDRHSRGQTGVWYYFVYEQGSDQ